MMVGGWMKEKYQSLSFQRLKWTKSLTIKNKLYEDEEGSFLTLFMLFYIR